MLDTATALIIEPNPAVASALCTALKYAGIREIIEAHDIASGFAGLERVPRVDCAVIDLSFPREHALGMAQRAADLSIPAVFTTADYRKVEWFAFGDSLPLCKPFLIRELLECLELEIERSRRLQLEAAANREHSERVRLDAAAERERAIRLRLLSAATRERYQRIREARAERQRHEHEEELRRLGITLPRSFRSS
ncbi:Response regulator (plasmid) [Rhodovastum atsumiense]|uniref:Response regulator n=1 Tax=Rhodovastum atsumiense TaxID=504468 RepID=A0A5M6ITI2_9PROT|nr:response regulator [Rhodovastum atsumiense]KAA5611626.1 response regulator [Rhodovastum atsumiense]CAH2606283.1 Response regulator [Rhodovastum atsumiense]